MFKQLVGLVSIVRVRYAIPDLIFISVMLGSEMQTSEKPMVLLVPSVSVARVVLPALPLTKTPRRFLF